MPAGTSFVQLGASSFSEPVPTGNIFDLNKRLEAAYASAEATKITCDTKSATFQEETNERASATFEAADKLADKIRSDAVANAQKVRSEALIKADLLVNATIHMGTNAVLDTFADQLAALQGSLDAAKVTKTTQEKSDMELKMTRLADAEKVHKARVVELTKTREDKLFKIRETFMKNMGDFDMKCSQERQIFEKEAKLVGDIRAKMGLLTLVK